VFDDLDRSAMAGLIEAAAVVSEQGTADLDDPATGSGDVFALSH